MVSPDRIDGLLKRRPCLVLDVKMNEEGGLTYILLAVTHFDGKNILETDILPEKRIYAMPIAPNKVDILNRPPLQTIPSWGNNYSYQLLVPTNATSDEVLSRDGRQTRLAEHEITRIQSFLTERGNFQHMQLKGEYATGGLPVPINVTPGIAAGADSSSTLDEDVAVVSKLIEKIIADKEAGGTLMEEVYETLDGGWITVGPHGRPLRVKNTGGVSERQESERRLNSRGSNNRRRPRTRATARATGRVGDVAEPNSIAQPIGRGMSRRRSAARNRGGFRGGRGSRV